MLWEKNEDVGKNCEGVYEIAGDKLSIKDEARFRRCLDGLIYNAVFNENKELKELAKWIIWEASIALGSPSASIHDYYMGRAKDRWKDSTVPAINIRGMTYDVARTAFKVLNRMNAASCIFEIARSEIGYTDQRPSEFTACVLAAAMRENYQGPVFLQGDHFQTKPAAFKKDPKAEVGAIKDLISEAIDAGFYNIDIDTSTLVDLSQSDVHEQQRANFETAAELTKFIRSKEPKGITVSIGGEIGEVGKKNSTPEELGAFVEGYNGVLNLEGGSLEGLSKISVQTGTSHGGVPLPDGSVAKVKLDFDVLEKLGELSRNEFHIGGVVQHGASTLPESAFDNFPKRQTLEVHLATGFQNVIFDSTAFPRGLKDQVYSWLDQNCEADRKSDWTPEQFYYKTRKKGFGPFKKEFWGLTDNTKMTLMSELSRTFEMMFKKLNIEGDKKTVTEHVKMVEIHKPKP